MPETTYGMRRLRLPVSVGLFLIASISHAQTDSVKSAESSAGPPETQPVLLQMIRDDAVHKELGLSEDQIQDVYELIRSVDGPWFRVRIRPEAERVGVIGELTARLNHGLSGVLDGTQISRLGQLQNQALGTRMLVRDETAAALGVSPTQRERLYKVYRDSDRRTAEIQAKVASGELDGGEAAKKVADVKESEKREFMDVLSNDQKRKLVSVAGPTFDFSKVKRIYPLAPEFTDQGAQWLQGSGVKLEDLRGKVVAVHFYAFQCINCRRNLPHYNGWHQDFADEGLVVIGIQTPETAAERSADRVAAAIEGESIGYPVLMDGASENWRQWSNTMWPTVYLVDKKGFIRRWWQGEMNWKGTPGEQQMRDTIRQLLDEEG